VVIEKHIYFCGYVDTGKIWPAVKELPKIFSDPDDHPLKITAVATKSYIKYHQ
jgi:hypothetical protein